MNNDKLQELERLTAAASGDDPPLGAMTAFFNAMEPATVAELIAAAAARPAPPVDAAGERAAFEAWAVTDEGGWMDAALKRNETGDEHRNAGDYADDDVHSQWEAWQARAALAVRRQDTPADSNSPEFDGIKTDAARWRQAIRYVGADKSPALGCCYFVLRGLFPVGAADLMRGGVAGHFTDAIDAAIAQARAAG